MLYYPFLNSLERLIFALTSLLKQASPSWDDQVPKNVADALTSVREALDVLTSVVRSLPVELDGYPVGGFGPPVNPVDLQRVLSVVMPVAEGLGRQCPLRSYFPVRLYREKCLVILETMEIYCGWKQQLGKAPHPARQGTKEFIDGGIVSSYVLLSPLDAKLDLLFLNLECSSYLARQAIEKEFSRSTTEI